MEDLLPDRRSGPSLDPGDDFPMNAMEEQADEGCKEQVFDHISIL